MDNIKHITCLIEILNTDLYERDEVISVSLLSALVDQSTFLLGPPGTAKSLIARRLSYAFNDAKHFEYLMQRFSTPEEIFGPVSIAELKKDNFERKIEGYLPEADFAFLDEIWKSSPAILNTLLTIINEKIFRNGVKEIKVPLKALIAASNETPPHGQGLEALFDRFIMRLFVPPMETRNNFEILLQGGPVSSFINIPDEMKISAKQLLKWKKEIPEKIKLSNETLNVIHDIRLELAKEENESLDVYISDRRWQKLSTILKASAYFCGRKETNLADTLLLRHGLWTTLDNREPIIKIVEDTVRRNGYALKNNLADFDREKEELEKEIQKELYYTENIYQTVKLKENDYYRVTKKFTSHSYGPIEKEFYLPVEKYKTNEQFNALDKDGNYAQIKCNFKGTGTCECTLDRNYSHSYGSYEPIRSTPNILYHKGDKKKDINPRLVIELQKAVKILLKKSDSIIDEVTLHRDKFKEELATPFVPSQIQKIALDAVITMLDDLKLRREDCYRLLKLTE